MDPEGFIPDASPDPAMNLKSSGSVYVSILYMEGIKNTPYNQSRRSIYTISAIFFFTLLLRDDWVVGYGYDIRINSLARIITNGQSTRNCLYFTNE